MFLTPEIWWTCFMSVCACSLCFWNIKDGLATYSSLFQVGFLFMRSKPFSFNVICFKFPIIFYYGLHSSLQTKWRSWLCDFFTGSRCCHRCMAWCLAYATWLGEAMAGKIHYSLFFFFSYWSSTLKYDELDAFLYHLVVHYSHLTVRL